MWGAEGGGKVDWYSTHGNTVYVLPTILYVDPTATAQKCKMSSESSFSRNTVRKELSSHIFWRENRRQDWILFVPCEILSFVNSFAERFSIFLPHSRLAWILYGKKEKDYKRYFKLGGVSGKRTLPILFSRRKGPCPRWKDRGRNSVPKMWKLARRKIRILWAWDSDDFWSRNSKKLFTYPFPLLLKLQFNVPFTTRFFELKSI